MYIWKKLLICICLSMALFSCTSNKSDQTYAPPVFSVTKELKSNQLSDGMLISYPFDMFVTGDYVFVLALADNTWLQVFQKTTGKHVGGLIGRGQGPGEIINATTLSYDEVNRMLFVFDEAAKKLLSYQLNNDADNLISYIEEKAFNALDGVVRRAWPMYNESFLVDVQPGEQKRFQLYSDNKATNEYNQFPVDLEEQRFSFMSATVALSPDREKMVVGTLYGGILEIFNLSEKIELTKVRKFYRPEVQYQGGALRRTDETIWGFSTLCATRKHIYGVLIGDKNPNLFNNISVFDWDGDEVAKYNTDCLVLRICASEQEPDKLYGIAFSADKEFYLVSFSL